MLPQLFKLPPWLYLFWSSLTRKRVVDKKEKDTAKNNKVMVTSTYGRDKQLINTVKDLQSKCENIDFQFVKKSAPSLNNILTKSKCTSLGTPFGKTMPCLRDRCKNCDLMSKKDTIVAHPSSKVVKTACGTCISRMLIYHTNCKICTKTYVRKTVQILGDRIKGHRNKLFTRVPSDQYGCADDYILGRHLFLCHNLNTREGGFNENYRFTILEHCSPFNLDINEHLWIHRLKCIKPFGLNSHDPFGIPLVL